LPLPQIFLQSRLGRTRTTRVSGHRLNVAPSTPRAYDVGTMNQYWRTYGRAALALLLVASLTIIVIHWHRDSRGQDCGVCTVQHMPALQSPTGNIVAVPATREWAGSQYEPVPTRTGVVLRESGRAPPRTFVSL